jgi:hypothetical protein
MNVAFSAFVIVVLDSLRLAGDPGRGAGNMTGKGVFSSGRGIRDDNYFGFVGIRDDFRQVDEGMEEGEDEGEDGDGKGNKMALDQGECHCGGKFEGKGEGRRSVHFWGPQ